MNEHNGLSGPIQSARADGRRMMERHIAERAVEHFIHKREMGADADLSDMSVTVTDGAGDIEETYRFGFGPDGELHFWNEDDGEEPPADVVELVEGEGESGA
jgi:hypothetical protein